MEGLAESFAASFSVSLEPNDTTSPHPRMVQYKVKPSNTPDQHVRRQRMLEEQKKRRRDVVNYARKLVEGSLDIEDISTEEMEAVEECENNQGRGADKRKKFNPYAYQLMLSEWLVDIPDDLYEEWFLVVCPIGKRNLVIAANGFTAAYTKSGYRINKFSSLLPGGGPKTVKPAEHTILDCLFSELTNTFYVLDVMSWRGHPVYDSETDFRFYWLHTKLQEEPQVSTVSSDNPGMVQLSNADSNPNKGHNNGTQLLKITSGFLKALHIVKGAMWFVGLSYFPCKPDTILQAVITPVPFQVDGLLFFHKRAHYTCGRTPLVGWLKPYMLPEILGVSVPDDVVAGAPPVNKLTLLKANQELNDGDQEKCRGTENEEDGESMDTSQQRVGKHGKKKNKKRTGSSKEAETSGGCYEDHTPLQEVGNWEKMEASQHSRKSKNRRKKTAQDMDISQVDDNRRKEFGTN